VIKKPAAAAPGSNQSRLCRQKQIPADYSVELAVLVGGAVQVVVTAASMVHGHQDVIGNAGT